jgi:hypothetical protein
MVGIRRPSHAVVVAYLALFVALGGSSYAAVTITGAQVRNSSLTGRDIHDGSLKGADVHDRSLLARDFKRGQLTAGLQGAPGAKGDTGAVGPAGPTTAAMSLAGTPPTAPDATASGTTSITTPTAGDVLTFGQLRLGMNCPAGAFNCSFMAGLYIDGDPVAGSAFSATVTQGTTEFYDLDLFGLADNVPPGPHTIKVGWKSTTVNHASWSSAGGTRGAALLVGG